MMTRRWQIALTGCVIVAAAYATHFSYGVFIPHLVAAYDWDRATLSAPFALYILLYSIYSYYSGSVTDRTNARKIVLVSGLLFALTYSALAFADAPWQHYLIFIFLASPAMGSIYIPLNATISKWFIARRGTALSIIGAGVSLGALIAPVLAAYAISVWGWQGAMVAMGLITGAIISLLSFTIASPPADWQPPGAISQDEGPGENPHRPPIEADWTFKDAFRTSAFWLILIVFFCTWSMIFMPFVHLPGYAEDLGFSAVKGALFVVALGLGGLIGRLFIGWLSETIGHLAALTLTLLLQVIGYLAIIKGGSFEFLFAMACILGLGLGSTSVQFNALVPDIFGRSHVGAISGFIFAISGGAAAIGPYLAGVLRDVTGSFEGAFWIAIGINLFGLLFVWFIRKPVRS